MEEQNSRTALLLGTEAIDSLKNSHVAVFGVGGVGGFTVEALARAGVGAIDLIDNDSISESNINRQLIALHSTVGRPKVEVFAERIADINPSCRVTTHKLFFLPDNSDAISFDGFDYVVDAVDTVSGKLEIIRRSKALGIPVISSMGAGNKLDPTMFEVEDIYKTSVCPLAKVMRYELKRRGIKKLKVVYSKEKPLKHGAEADGRRIPASCAFVPSVAGLIIAGEVIKDLTK